MEDRKMDEQQQFGQMQQFCWTVVIVRSAA
jgi:hypothetical protein